MAVSDAHVASPALLVGDNPFLGVSHLSQEQAKARGAGVTSVTGAAQLLEASLENGANGYLFSVGELSLSVLSALRRSGRTGPNSLYAIAPWSFEYVRAAVRLGGLPGVARMVGARVARSRNVHAVAKGVSGAARNDLGSLYEAYMSYEVERVRSAAGNDARIASFLLHEVVGDMALGLDMEWLFRAHVRANHRAGTQPGFNTRNLPFLVTKFRDWGIPLDGAVIAAPFNPVGFQMCPSKEACEKTLSELVGSDVIAFSIMAAGHLGYADAIDYAARLPNLHGVAVGVSKLDHARSTFRDLGHALS